MPAALARLPAAQRARLRPAPDDRSLLVDRPMLATLSDRRAFDERWIFERKLDGVRALGIGEAGGVRLLSRTGRAMDRTYPEVVDALAAQDCRDVVVDGEIVALRDGRTDFSLLQQRLGLTEARAVAASPVEVFYYVFDLLGLDGWSTAGLPQRTRKTLLRDTLNFHGPLRYTPHRNYGGDQLLDEACAKGWEGLIAKRADAPYQARRSGDWLKLKCAAGQEFVIGGFTEPSGSRIGFGALLIGYYDAREQGGGPGTGGGGGGDGRPLRYAGKVGTGYDQRTLRALRERLDTLRQPGSPFADPVRERTAHWVGPELVAQVGFSEWTRDGMLRHPRFLGLRDDKRPQEVVRELPRPG
ncbi:non-homologous end-joining DNA ligase [Streptomyces sp. DvalAA-14]|uniref:non-homologous end-joining DNA ligase n=2 Tax=unclassified Streptomyces TaxID=2593676 RepID=UPI00351DD612